MKRHEHHLVDDEGCLQHGKFAIIDNKLGRGIGHLRSRIVADTVVRELNQLEAADAA